jgi:hypothetical protein
MGWVGTSGPGFGTCVSFTAILECSTPPIGFNYFLESFPIQGNVGADQGTQSQAFGTVDPLNLSWGLLALGGVCQIPVGGLLVTFSEAAPARHSLPVV